MKKAMRKVTGIILASFLLASCEQEPYEGYEKSDLGFYYQFFKRDEKGSKPKVGDIVMMKMTYKSEKDSSGKDSVIFDSKMAGKNGMLDYQIPPTSSFKGSVEDALLMMSTGDSASFLISADSVYLKTFKAPSLPPYIKKGSLLTFNIKLESFKTKEQAEKENAEKLQKLKDQEQGQVEKYLAENKITTQPTASGLYYIEQVKGKGKNLAPGDTAVLHYTGKFLDGKTFDSSLRGPEAPPVRFPVGVPGLIAGFSEGMMMMSKGSKAQLLIPSALGYGPQGNNGIPPYSPLLFEIEIIDIVEGKLTNAPLK